MANYLSSRKTDFGQYQTPSDLNIVNTVLATRQNKYDSNLATIEQTLQNFGNIDLIREEDREYLYNKVQGILDTVNAAGITDLSRSDVSRSINNQIKSAIDERVINDIYQTKKVRAYETQAQQIKEKKPELYSDINYTYGLDSAGYSKWVSGQTNELGNLTYVPYADVNKKVNDLVLDLETKKKDQKISIPDPNNPGLVKETTISGLSQAEIRQVAENYLTPSDKKQIEINGWYNYNGYSNPQQIRKDVENFISVDTANIDNKISSLQLEIDNGGLSDAQAAKKNADIEAYKVQKSGLIKDKSTLLADPRAAATYMERERFYQDTVSRFQPLFTQSVEYKKDDAYWANKNYQLNQAKFQYEIDKDKKEEAQKQSGELLTSTVPTPTEDILQVEQTVDNNISTFNTQLQGELTGYRTALEGLASTGNEQAKRVIDIYKNNLANKTAGQTDLDIFNQTVQQNIKTNSPLRIIGNKNYMADITDVNDKYNSLLIGRNNATKAAKEEHIAKTLDNQETLKAFYDNPSTTMIWYGTSGKESEHSVRDVLIKNGIIDTQGNQLKSLKTAPGLLQNLEKSYYAAGYLAKGNSDNLTELARIFGEDPKQITRTYTTASTAISPTTGAVSPSPSMRTTVDPNTKTGQFLARAARTNLAVNTISPFAPDRNLAGDDSTIGAFLKTNYKESDSYKQGIQGLYGNLPSTQVISVPSTNEGDFNRVQSLINLASSETPFTLFDKTAPLNIALEGDYVRITQNRQTTKEGTVAQSTRIPLTDFQRNAPDLTNRLNFNTEASFYTPERVQASDLISDNVKFFNADNNSQNFKYASQVLLKTQPQNSVYLKSEDAQSYLTNTYRTRAPQLTELPQVIDSAIRNASNFTITGEIQKDFNNNPYLNLNLKNSNGETVTSYEVYDFKAADNFKKIIDNAPQVYYGIFLDTILQKQVQAKTLGNTDDVSYLKLLNSLQQ